MNENKEIEILTKNSYRYWGLLNSIITSGIPILYLIITYDLFKFKKSGLTMWGWVVVILLFTFIKNFIRDFILDIRNNLSIVGKRITLISVLFVLTLLLLLSSIWVKDLTILLFVIVGSMLVSLYPFYKYHTNKERYERLKDMVEEDKDKKMLKNGKIVVK